MKGLVLGVSLLVGLNADMYMHMPRGSNNRLNEASANRNNANRLFDSQNNNRGGYNVGDLDPVNGFDANDWMAEPDLMWNFQFLYVTSTTTQKQYEMLYFEDSYISATWTNQHGTGNKKLNSYIVLQFICDTFERAPDTEENNSEGSGPSYSIPSGGSDHVDSDTLFAMKKHGLRVELYNGGNTDTPDSTNDINNIDGTYSSNMAADYGRRESEEYYYLCQQRFRNYGLFHADQNLNGYSQIYTRQNPDGTRRGLECPEERDYFPWWHPSPFHDIAVITPDVSYCEQFIASESQNVKEKFQCVRDTGNDQPDSPTQYLPDPDELYVYLQYNETGCDLLGGSWEGFKWGGEEGEDEPECVDSYWTKVNYLGNTDNSLRGGMQAKYDWKIPSYDDLVEKHYCWEYEYEIEGDHFIEDAEDGELGTGGDDINVKCVRMMFRIRYNMSTMDYDPYLTDSKQDYDDNAGILSPIEQNPDIDVGIYAQGLRLAINTAQTGRVFQDNSHTFLVCEKPDADWADATYLYNVNVRGKRGNIVQTFPAVEYDFEPKHMEITEGSCMHFQWTGSNTHNNGNPGGDGQTGDAGEGRGGSDRTNFVQMYDMTESYPLTYDKFDDDFFDHVDCYHPLFPDYDVSSDDARMILGTAGFYRGTAYAEYHIANTGTGQESLLDVLLDNVSASFRQGLICCIQSGALDGEDSKEFSFLSTRNNNFTNRAQKFKLLIISSMDDTDMTKW